MRKTFSAAEPEAQSPTAGVTIRQGLLDVWNARSLVVEYDPQASPLFILDHFELRGAPASIIKSIAGQFARSSNQLGLIYQIKPERDSLGPDGLAYDDHILTGSNRKRFSL